MSDKKNNVIIGGSLMPSLKDTPLDARSRIDTIADIDNIELPYVGMMFYVKDEKKFYVVNSLKSKVINGIKTCLLQHIKNSILTALNIFCAA